jgi:hypothetical protein
MEAGVLSQASACKIYGWQSDTGTGFFSEYFGFLLESYHQCAITIFILILLLPEGKTREAWKPSNKAVVFWI